MASSAYRTIGETGGIWAVGFNGHLKVSCNFFFSYSRIEISKAMTYAPKSLADFRSHVILPSLSFSKSMNHLNLYARGSKVSAAFIVKERKPQSIFAKIITFEAMRLMLTNLLSDLHR